MDGKGIRLLIVDDENELREALKRKFHRLGFDVHTASGGHEALKTCLKHDFDIILTDVRMPEGSGIELLDGIKSAKLKHPPVIICISAFSDLTKEDAILKGAHALLPKPVESSVLISTIEHFHLQRAQRLEAEKARGNTRN